MHVVIVGCGRVGSTLARQLVAQNHSVTVVDRKKSAFQRLGEGFTGRTLAGIGFDRDVLIEAGIQEAGAVAAVTNGDNSNILVARVARENFRIDKVVARIYDPKRAEVYQRLGIATVATVTWTAERVMRRILPEESGIEWVDPTAKVTVIEREIPRDLVGKRYASLDVSGRVKVVAVNRLGSAAIPSEDLVGQEGDIVHFAVATPDLNDVMTIIGAQASDGH
ncbi:MAG: potassium channel family protein [Ilumatobacteraceae bacterium]|jgi:trk system potassium uptake protein TrkA|nr:TrkA family potassium uptake protein [Actinomycetota bacterium]MDA3011574.1 TrkA family potassium uptake protein [Actinomycetota bacterium]MDA3024879.1 TrkA family potassium uptake protein [Actinomycetota bacterium]NBU56173.1 TrkA family potassium uptake protein [Acidimicrobiia bacterium]